MLRSKLPVGVARRGSAFGGRRPGTRGTAWALTSAIAVAACWGVACEDAGGGSIVDDTGAAGIGGTGGSGGAAGAGPVGGSGGSAGNAGGPELLDAGTVDASAGDPVDDAGREPTSTDTLDAGGPDADVVTTCSPDSGCPLTQLCEEVCALHAQAAQRLGRCSYSFDEEGCLSSCLAEAERGQCDAPQRDALECLVVSERAICELDYADPDHECYIPHDFYIDCSEGP